MSKVHAQQIDPAVEEVLASIRQIMADDMAEAKHGPEGDVVLFPAPAASKHKVHDVEDNDILNLTNMVTKDGSIVSLSKKGIKMTKKHDNVENFELDPATEEVLDLTNDTAADQDVPDSQTSAEQAAIFADSNKASPTFSPTDEIESIMSAEAVEKSTAAFKELNKLNTEMQKKIQDGSFGSQTVDELMRELLRPMLKDWLDSYLPSLVKWLVAEKIEQMIRERKETKQTTSE